MEAQFAAAAEFHRDDVNVVKETDETVANDEEALQRERDQQQFERAMRAALARQEQKRAEMLRIFRELTTFARTHNNFDTTAECYKNFVRKHGMDPHPVVAKVLQLGELAYTRLLIKSAEKYEKKLQELNSRIKKDELALLEFDGWVQRTDETGRVYFVNQEGLSRLDIPIEWMLEEIDRERRREDARAAINDTEEFMANRGDNLLDEIHTDLQQCKQLAAQLEELRCVERYKVVQDAHDVIMLACAANMEIIEMFNYEPPTPIPGIPMFGVTNAYSQRRLRIRPNFHNELEEYFDDDDDDDI